MTITQRIEQKVIYRFQPRILNLKIKLGIITACLEDGRQLSIPPTWLPRLRKANLEQLRDYRILPDGYHIHWPKLDEDISLRIFTDGLEAGCC